MPDTGAPWNIPYVASTDLVSDWPADSLALANAIDAGLDAAGGLVAVKHALFTGTQTNSTAQGADFAVTDLSITHTLANSANKLIIMATLGLAANGDNRGGVGIKMLDGSTLIGGGAAAGNRTPVTVANARLSGTGDSDVGAAVTATFVYEPGDTASHTYALHASNTTTSTQTIYINRPEGDQDQPYTARAASSLVMMEVKV